MRHTLSQYQVVLLDEGLKRLLSKLMDIRSQRQGGEAQSVCVTHCE